MKISPRGIVMTGLMSFISLSTYAQVSLPFSQNWTDVGLITINDDWSSVPGIVGYRGDDLTTATGTDPQTILVDGSSTEVDVNANQTNPNTFATGGVAEFEITNPTIALTGSNTADAPHIVLRFSTTGVQTITVSYNLRDIDGSADNAVQPVAVQYRVGGTGNYTNLAAGFVADATSGPNLATLVTPVSVVLPSDADDQGLVEVRIMTTNAAGSDEWVGIDDITVEYESALPVTLSSFTGAYEDGGSVHLAWTTLTEVNNYGFDVERRAAGPAEFATVPGSFVAGHGTTTEPHAYAFIDHPGPEATGLVYRLRQIDLDGTLSYSEPVSVDLPTSAGEQVPRIFSLSQNYPNPFNPETSIRFTVSTTGRATLAVFNALGQEVTRLFDGIAESNRQYTVTFRGEQIASGVYVYRLDTAEQTALRKMIFIR